MNGQRFFKRHLDRRLFLLQAGLLAGGVFLNGCIRRVVPKKDRAHISGTLLGPDARAGHMLRDRVAVPSAAAALETEVLIVGSGISGLSAARWLRKNGRQNFLLIDLEAHAGGNAHHRSNAVSAYPLGAHYITIANNHDTRLIDFLSECGVITRQENGLPVYNETYLCFDPEERLLINGQWQEGLIPEFGITAEEKKQITAFLKHADDLRSARGQDGLFAFDIPVDRSSADPAWRKLDRLSFADYLQQLGFNARPLLWYLEYCCKDDFGQSLEHISAWAGMHYFSARKGRAANAPDNAVLTWPEGNGWLTQQLKAGLEQRLRTQQLCTRIALTPEGKPTATVFNPATNTTTRITANKVIMATPQYVNERILDQPLRRGLQADAFRYAPWFVANLTLKDIPPGKGAPLCWDNVAYLQPSVGYVNATHQALRASEGKKVITFYLPLCKREARLERLSAYTRTFDQWLDMILEELEFMHPGITPMVEHMEGWVWGHGMIAPAPGFISGSARQQAARPLNNTIFFAHTDLAGISIFEEAFHQGIRAAEQVLKS